jgi:hypothetical protein
VNIDELLAEARSHLRRVRADEIPRLLDDGALVVDIRPVEPRSGSMRSLHCTARTLQQLGLTNATDLVGGYQEWIVTGTKPT